MFPFSSGSSRYHAPYRAARRAPAPAARRSVEPRIEAAERRSTPGGCSCRRCALPPSRSRCARPASALPHPVETRAKGQGSALPRTPGGRAVSARRSFGRVNPRSSPPSWPFPYYGSNARPQAPPQVTQLFGSPSDVVVLTRVEMELVDDILSATEYDRNVVTVGEARFVVHAPSCSGLTVCEVRNDEPGSPEFGDDLVVYLVDMLLAIDSDGLVASIRDSRPYSLLPDLIHGLMEPHRYKRRR